MDEITERKRKKGEALLKVMISIYSLLFIEKGVLI